MHSYLAHVAVKVVPLELLLGLEHRPPVAVVAGDLQLVRLRLGGGGPGVALAPLPEVGFQLVGLFFVEGLAQEAPPGSGKRYTYVRQ